MSGLSRNGRWTILLNLLSAFARAQDAATPSAVNVPAAQYWDGIDGKWSTFGIQVGTPAQTLRVLPMTQQGTMLVVVPEGCTADDPSTCGDDRGSLFLIDRSDTWDQQGLYQLNLLHEEPLGYTGNNGIYGYDAVTLGWPGNNLPSVNRTIVAGIATKDFYSGGLALNPWPVNFTTLTQSTPSLMTNLKNQSKIPSLTWGYTAGYYANEPPSFGSLTLGGYDTSRLEPNNVNFVMNSDITRDLYVAIQSIQSGSNTLLPNPVFAFIDSAIPTIWLPLEACRAFESAFGLVYDETEELYLINDTLHTQLQSQNPSVTFQIGPQTSGESVSIEMPYGAFALEAASPFVSNASRYFPLKRANESSQYTLGRAFLQNAYIVANYEYFNFSLHQATYPGPGSSENIVLLPSREMAENSSSDSSGLGTGAIIGIAVGGAVVGLLIIGGIVWFCLKKKKESKKQLEAEPMAPDDREKVDPENPYERRELDATGTPIYEAGGSAMPMGHEVEGKQSRYEMDGQYKDPRYEMDAAGKPWMNKPMEPVELPVHEIAASEAHSETTTPFMTPAATPGPNGITPSSSPPPAGQTGRGLHFPWQQTQHDEISPNPTLSPQGSQHRRY